MCGIAGILSPQKQLVQLPLLQKMADSLAHRGPDGEGFWINPFQQVGLAHRRLAIIDLSAAANQPMPYNERYTIVYNGEIYNYKEIKIDLQKAGYHFKTNSDTEVIIAAYDFYKDACVKYFDGMFAFAIWDEQTKVLFCARDVFGEKPFYYFIDKNIFAFASEMKALWAIGINKIPDEKMMLNYLSLGYVQNAANKSQTFFKDIFALLPAHTATFNMLTMQLHLHKYRDINKENSIKISEIDAANELHNLLNRSIQKRLRSDVAIGTSLSGGLDSSTIAYYIKQIKAQTTQPNFKTFSAIFPGFEKDESAFIQQFTQQQQIENITVTPTAQGLLNDIEKLCYHQEEPFASSSIYAQFKVFETAAANGIKVLLDGQGADETLAGYSKYLHWYIQELVSRNKFIQARKERKALQKNHPFKWNIKNTLATYLPAHATLALEKKAYYQTIADNNISYELQRHVKGREWQGIYKPVVTKLNDILYYDTMQFGLDELLRYADRNSMAHGVEVRLPFLNVALLQFIFSLPSSLKINAGFGKYILRKMMEHELPNNLVWNPTKIGFEPPQQQWMHQPTMQHLITDAKQFLVNERILRPAVLQQKIKPQKAHAADNYDWRYLNLSTILQQ
ncbi:asparagine synthase (glutamine-hydrolyzing) [Ferruginibacter yonginensis]|uniref:asparagine synthase (glutamine-hydrolyzing) n=1 Tax=Ferruginibacter yonginensis TaxID=1310416 RepID=A0ABV8QSY2_9BACT